MLNILNFLINYTVSTKTATNYELRSAKAFIYVWLTTTLIMWFYVLFSYTVYESPIVAQIGLLCSIIHTLTPYIYKKTKSKVLSGLNITLTAIVFQVTFALYNGGIDSPSIIWLTVHPVIISFFASKRLILFSVFLNMFLVIGLTVLGKLGYFSRDLLSEDLTDWMRLTTLVFLDIIIATYTVVFINTTKQSEQDLSNRNNLIENLMRIITHDINNALVVSTLSTKMLETQISDDSSAKEKLKLISNSNNQIIEISKSILSWMKANDNQIPLVIKPVEFISIENYIKESFTPIIEAKNQTLLIESDIPAQTLILVDKNAFRNQVVSNIVSNAIKFTPKNGTIRVSSKIIDKKLEMTFSDQGIGIPEKLLENIFNPAKSISRRGTDGERGTGFGMPIVKTIIDGMKGSIHISSKSDNKEPLDNGTVVTINIPMA